MLRLQPLSLLGLLKSTLWVLDNLLKTLGLSLGGALELIDDRVALEAGLVHEDTGDLGGTDAEEEEVDGSEAVGRKKEDKGQYIGFRLDV